MWDGPQYPLIGRPYGGCFIFYKKSLAGCILICPTGLKQVNAIVQLADGQLLLIANVYLPTNDGIVSSQRYLRGIRRAAGLTAV